MSSTIPQNYVIGVDFGTDSVRSVLVDAADGRELGSAVFAYPRWGKGLYCDASVNRFRQHPLDHILGLETTVKECVRRSGVNARLVRAISVDTTGSTPVAVNAQGVPLALTPGFEQNPNAMFILWKDHTAVKEAAEINAHAASFAADYLKYVGGVYSSEWYWAKWLHILRADEAVRNAASTFVEHCDWVPFLLTGGTDVSLIKRSRCAAGHKALWADEWGGYPPEHFLSGLDPLLGESLKRLRPTTYTADQAAGTLCPDWAGRLGLAAGVLVGCGAFDAHMGAVGGQVEPFYLSKVMGTSTCDILVVPAVSEVPLVKGICGQVDGSVTPGLVGFEAGQSAFGDTYAWFRSLLEWPLQFLESDTLRDFVSGKILEGLGVSAGALPLDEAAELSVDWLNGRRTPDADQRLKGSISGLNLGSDAPRVFRALAEGTCFGARAIVERFVSEGVPVLGVTGIGGVARKSPYIMQLMADVLHLPVRVSRSEQTCALGAAMFAAVVAGLYGSVEEAMAAMGQGFDREYVPDRSLADFYARRYAQYVELGKFQERSVYELS